MEADARCVHCFLSAICLGSDKSLVVLKCPACERYAAYAFTGVTHPSGLVEAVYAGSFSLGHTCRLTASPDHAVRGKEGCGSCLKEYAPVWFRVRDEDE